VICPGPAFLASEDFAFVLQEKKGTDCYLGGRPRKMVQHPEYSFNTAILPVGAAYWAALIEHHLRCCFRVTSPKPDYSLSVRPPVQHGEGLRHVLIGLLLAASAVDDDVLGHVARVGLINGPSTTWSVKIESCGSMKRNSRIVAK